MTGSTHHTKEETVLGQGVKTPAAWPHPDVRLHYKTRYIVVSTFLRASPLTLCYPQSPILPSFFLSPSFSFFFFGLFFCVDSIYITVTLFKKEHCDIYLNPLSLLSFFSLPFRVSNPFSLYFYVWAAHLVFTKVKMLNRMDCSWHKNPLRGSVNKDICVLNCKSEC